jgi:hypothetical protein
VPRLVKFTGTVKGAVADSTANGIILGRGVAPTNVVAITFSLYAEQSGSVPLWSEVQNVRVDAAGHYTIQLGSTKADGLPVELFSSAQAQWLGVQLQGQAEQPRVMLLSVPYALKAADADTFGGKPPSAYMQTAGTDGSGSGGGGLAQRVKNDHPLGLTGSGTTGYIPLWTNASNLTSSVIYQSSGHEIGIGTSDPLSPLDVLGNSSVSIVDATQTSSSGGAAVWGSITATSGNGTGVLGATDSPQGRGVGGSNAATTGTAVGTFGGSASSMGVGVMGYGGSTTGANFGVSGSTASPAGVGVIGQNLQTTGEGFGVVGNSSSSSGTGVLGQAYSETGTTYGVWGTADSPSGVGVGGTANAQTGFAIGVSGNSASTSGVGVVGHATATTGSAFGVKGTTDSSTGVGVFGIANSTTGLNGGVEGAAASPDGFGLYGINADTAGNAVAIGASTGSQGGIAVYAVGVEPSVTTSSTRPVGVWGTTNVSGGIGIGGTTDDGNAVAGANYSSDAPTAWFQNQIDDPSAPAFIAGGTAFVKYCWIDTSGDLSCTGTVTHGSDVDNGTRTVALYAMESPENWFEDAGSARLTHGSAVVQLEPVFAQTVNSGVEYHVFLTPKGDCKGLYVTNETASSFEVRELGGGSASIAFDYRIMARRKGYENVRLADLTKRVAKFAVLNKGMQRKPPQLPAKPSPAASPVPEPRRTPRMVNPVPHLPRAYPVAEKINEPKHN